MAEKQHLTLASLFDGIGGFPYAASFFGIRTLWASEILPAAISVTKRHLPRMEHVGDITKLHGGSLPPVDIITFGSPCQGLSLAGKRFGLADPRSGLFSEAIRIINEMREATNDRYPTWAVWENVPGALSSGTPHGSDFKAVLEAFTEAEIPFPRSGKWTNAGMVRGGRADVAWIIYNSQHFGTAQRRRRIFLVADFGGRRAGEILFIPKSLRGYFASGGTPRQGFAAYAPRGSDGADENRRPVICAATAQANSEVCEELCPTITEAAGKSGSNKPYIAAPASNCLTPWDTQQSRIFTDDGKSPALAGADGGGGRNPGGLVFAAFLGGAGEKARSIGYSETISPTLKAGACGFMAPCLCEPKLARTLTARGDSSPCADRGQNFVAIPALAQGDGEDVLCAATGQTGAEILENLSPTLTCHHEQPILYGAVGVHQNQSGDVNTADTAYALATNGNATGRNAPLVAHPKVSGTLCASGAGLSRPAGLASETDLCVAYRVQGDSPNGDGVNEHVSGTLLGRTAAPNGVSNEAGLCVLEKAAAVDCRNLRETEELSGTLQAKSSGSYSLNYQNPVRMGYIVRRLTPTECERLQGYSDGWTEYGHDGKLISDTARYQMLGNSVAVPCVAYIMMGIARAESGLPQNETALQSDFSEVI